MSITRALNELKLLDSRIKRAINSLEAVDMQIGSKKIKGHMTVDEYNNAAKSTWDSINALITRRNAIKSAIVVSNALTKVKIGDKTYTVAEVIERKGSIDYDKMLLNLLRSQYNQVSYSIVRENDAVKNRLDQHIANMLGKDTKGKEQEIEMLTKSFEEMNSAKMVDPLDVRKRILTLTEEIETFESECDFVLSESNVKTMITIPE